MRQAGALSSANAPRGHREKGYNKEKVTAADVTVRFRKMGCESGSCASRRCVQMRLPSSDLRQRI